MADLKENQMAKGTPRYLRGIDSNGNGIQVENEKVRNFIGMYRYVHILQIGEEKNLGNLGHGLFLLSCPETGRVASYAIGSYGGTPSNDPKYFGDFGSNASAGLVFGRKETNGDFFLKNNREGVSNVRITRISML